MPIEYSRTFEIADMTVRFPVDAGRIGLELFPTALKGRLVPRRLSLRGEFFIDVLPGNDPWPAFVVESLAQVKIAGDPYPGAFATGHTMRGSPSANAFVLETQHTERNGGASRILTTVSNDAGHRIEHRLSCGDGDQALEVSTEFFNDSAAPVTLEMLASFSLGGITPFAADDAPGRLRVHRFRSVWSAEGRLETRTIEQLHLERSWSGAGAFSERFGQLGTMPVRKWFPFVAAEDTEAGVLWGAQLAWAGTWQMEIFRQHDDVCLSGGLGDREFGHWMKTLAPGESLSTPSAWISCVHGSLDDLCDRLTAVQHRAADSASGGRAGPAHRGQRMVHHLGRSAPREDRRHRRPAPRFAGALPGHRCRLVQERVQRLEQRPRRLDSQPEALPGRASPPRPRPSASGG